MNDIEFEDDLGRYRLGLAFLTTDRAAIGVGYAIGSIVLASVVQWVAFPIVAFLWLNDDRWVSGEGPKALSGAKPASLPMGHTFFEPAAQHPAAPGHSPIEVHSHTAITNVIPSNSSEQGTAITTVGPGQAERQTTPPDLSAYPDVADRMGALLKALDAAGFPIGKLVKHPFVWAHGPSQSGKTTFVQLLVAIRMALGADIEYASADEDIEPLRWAKVSLGPERYADEVSAVADTIRAAKKGTLIGKGFVFDELYRAFTDLGLDLNELLGAVIAKGSKTKVCFVGISQADTSGAHGLKNIDTAWRTERVSVKAIHTEDHLGERSPTGRYQVTNGAGTEEWGIPPWMLTMVNSYGTPCPVVWMLHHFPELRSNRAVTSMHSSEKMPDRPPTPTTAAPAWASEVPETAKVFGFDVGSESNRQSNRAEPAIEPAEPPDTKDSSESENNRTGSPNHESNRRTAENAPKTRPVFTKRNLTREQTIATIQDLLEMGMSKTKIIERLWDCTKGGGAAYTSALAQYNNLMGD